MALLEENKVTLSLDKFLDLYNGGVDKEKLAYINMLVSKMFDSIIVNNNDELDISISNWNKNEILSLLSSIDKNKYTTIVDELWETESAGGTNDVT